MPFKRLNFVGRSRVALSVLAFACALSATAEAGPRGAPIVFKNETMNTAAPVRMAQTSMPAAPKMRSAPIDKATARIEFVYPDSRPAAAPEFRTASVQSTPVASTARESAYTEAPQMVAPAPPAVEAVSLQAMPEPAGQGMAYTSLTPVAQPTAPVNTAAEYAETGVAVVYGEEFSGLPTANGEVFSQMELTAAHPSLPLPSLVQVTNVDTGREVVVRVNDRGPFEDGANVQLSRKAAEALGMDGAGKSNVRLRYLSPAPVLATQPVSQKSSMPALPPLSAPKAEQVVTQMASAPVSADDELLGGGTSAATAPRLMAMTVAPKPATFAAPAAATGDVFVQLASFSDIGNAEAMLRNIDASLPVEIMPARVNGADFFRVRVGPFQDQAAAEQIRADLSYKGTADGRIVTGY